MKRFTQSVLLWCCIGVGMAAVTAACGGDDEAPNNPDEPPPPPPPPPPGPCDTITSAAQFAECHQAAVCDVVTMCGLGALGSNSCDDVVPGFFLLESIGYQQVADVQEAIDAGRTSFNGEAAKACVQQVIDASCIGIFVSEGSLGGGACENILVGLGNPGDACSQEFECENGYCQGGKEGTGDTCDPTGECVAYAADGASCASAPCRNGSYCINGTCETGQAGAVCYGDGGCDEGFECSVNALVAGAPGVCEATNIPAQGDACADPGSLCDDSRTLICLPATPAATTGTCQPPPSTPGALCVELCNANLACVHSGDSEFGECTPISELPGLGDECGDEPGFVTGPCGLFLECKPGATKEAPYTCQNRGSEGDPCNVDLRFTSGGPGFGDCNIGLFCSNEIVNSPNPVCVKPGAAGDFCRYDAHCAEGTCGPSGTCGEAVACEGEIFF